MEAPPRRKRIGNVEDVGPGELAGTGLHCVQEGLEGGVGEIVVGLQGLGGIAKELAITRRRVIEDGRQWLPG